MEHVHALLNKERFCTVLHFLASFVWMMKVKRSRSITFQFLNTTKSFLLQMSSLARTPSSAWAFEMLPLFPAAGWEQTWTVFTAAKHQLEFGRHIATARGCLLYWLYNYSKHRLVNNGERLAQRWHLPKSWKLIQRDHGVKRKTAGRLQACLPRGNSAE